jgi:hypothetical protein
LLAFQPLEIFEANNVATAQLERVEVWILSLALLDWRDSEIIFIQILDGLSESPQNASKWLNTMIVGSKAQNTRVHVRSDLVTIDDV